MQLRRPLSALFVTAALVGAGGALSGCEAPGSSHFQGGAGATASLTQPSNDNLPHLSNRIPSGPTGNNAPANGG